MDALAGDYLRQLARESGAGGEFFAATQDAGAGSDGEGRTWTRDERHGED